MSRVPRLDGSPSNTGLMEEEAMCERASFQYCRNPNQTWPFLFSLGQDNRWYVARQKRRSQYNEAADVGEALL